MTCTYTGARVHIEPYGFTVTTDLHEVAGAAVVRWNPKTHEDRDGGCTHVLRSSPNGVWETREGLIVVPSEYVEGPRR